MDAERITTSTRDPGEMRDQFERWLRATLPEGSDARVVELTSPESNGMSSETLLVDAAWTEDGAEVTRRLVARVEPPATDYPVFTTYDLDMQFRVMRLVEEHTDVPVPATHWHEPDPSVLGGAFFVMDRVDGLVPPDVLPYTFGDNWVVRRSPRRPAGPIQDSAVRAMAGIHSIRPTDHDLVLPRARPARRHRPRAEPQPLEGLPRVGGRGHPVPAPRRLLRLADRQPARRHQSPTPCRGGTVASAT